MGLLDQAKQWMTPERALAFQGIGLGLSQLGAGQPVNLSPVYDALQQRKDAAQMRKVMEVPGIMDRFTPQQQAVLASMPESLATKIIMEHAFAPEPEPVKGVEVGGQLVNPITGAVMYEGKPDPQYSVLSPEEIAALNLPPGVYERAPNGNIESVATLPGDPIADLKARAAAAGLVEGTPEYQRFMIDQGKVPLVDMRGETEYDKARGKAFADQMTGYEKEGAAASSALNTLDAMSQAMKDPAFYSGAMGDSVLTMKRTAKALGFDPEGVDSMEAFNALAKKAALDAMGGSLGAGFSNADRSFVEQQVANLETTPEGNTRIIAMQRAIQQRKVEIMKRAQTYEREHGRLDEGFAVELQDWAEKNPMFPPNDAAPSAGAAGIPEGIDPEDWKFMSDEEKALFQ